MSEIIQMSEFNFYRAAKRAAKTYALTDAPVAYFVALRALEEIESPLRTKLATSLGCQLIGYLRTIIPLSYGTDLEASKRDPNVFKLMHPILGALCEMSPAVAHEAGYANWFTDQKKESNL